MVAAKKKENKSSSWGKKGTFEAIYFCKVLLASSLVFLTQRLVLRPRPGGRVSRFEVGKKKGIKESVGVWVVLAPCLAGLRAYDDSTSLLEAKS